MDRRRALTSFAFAAATVLLLPVLASPASATDDWPVYGATPGHEFSNAATPPAKLGLVWGFTGNLTSTGTPLGSAVVAHESEDDYVYVADVDRTAAPAGPHVVVHKLVAANGSDEPALGAWYTRVVIPNAAAIGPPRSLAVGGARVFALFTVNVTAAWEYQEVLVALDAASGQVQWSFNGTARWNVSSASATKSAPILGGGFVFFGSQDGYVYAVNAAAGTLAWSAPVGAPVETVPATSGSLVYVTAGDLLLYLDVNGTTDGVDGTALGTGDLLDFVVADGTILASPVVSGLYVYLDAVGNLSAYGRTFAGAPKWTNVTVYGSVGTPAIAGGLIVARRTDGRVYAFDRVSGEVGWIRASLAAPAFGEDMAAASGRLYASAVNGPSADLVTLDATDGAVVDRNATTARTTLGAPVAALDQVFVSEGAKLLAFRGQPDLAVLDTDVTLTLGQVSGGVARGHAIVAIRNVGTEPASGIRVRVYDGPPATGDLLGTFRIGNASKPLNPGGRSEGNATADRDWAVGRHEVHVVIDAALTETNVANNEAIAVLYVSAGPSPPPAVVGEGPYWAALLLGFLIGVAVLYLPFRRLRAIRRKEAEPKEPSP